MFKTVSAAAIALSLVAAPAFAQGNTTTTTTAPVTTPAKPVVHKTHKVRHVVLHKKHKHIAQKHTVKKHIAKAPKSTTAVKPKVS